jgi:hypothetical protein
MTEQTPPAGEPGREPTEEELRAAYEAEIKRLRVEDIVVQTIVSLVNLGGRRAGFVPGAEDERDLDQVRIAIEGTRALLPLVEQELGPEASTIRQALSQLQMMYAKASGQGEPDASAEGAAPAPPAAEPPPAPAEEEGAKPGEPGPAQRSGRLWIPGQ